MARPTPVISVLSETEIPGGWLYRVTIRRDTDSSTHSVTLSWADHDYWTGGRAAPSALVERLVALLAHRLPDLPARFDASTARRWVPDLDGMLGARPEAC